MSSYKDYKKRALQNPEVKAEYDIIQTMIDANNTFQYRDNKRNKKTEN